MASEADLRDFGGTCRLFPLPGVVLFPHAVQPLHIFEPRYRQMTRDALAGDRLIAMVQARPVIDPAGEAEPELEEVACLGKILDHQRLPDGRYHLLLLGLKRARLVREVPGPMLYRRAEVELLEDIEPEPAAVASLGDALRDRFRAFCGGREALDPDLEGLLATDPHLGMLTDVIAHALGLPAAVKQAFLADPCVEDRARGLIAILRKLGATGPDPDGPAFPPTFSAN